MTNTEISDAIAFAGSKCIASGPLMAVIAAAKTLLDQGNNTPILIFNTQTSAVIDVDFRGSLEDVRKRLNALSPDSTAPRTRGRPALGVIAREVTLLPRHWEWLSKQRGGASATLRRLIDQARRDNANQETVTQARDALYRFITTIAGNTPGYEEAIRALFAGDAERFANLTSNWPADVRDHAWRLSPAAFSLAPLLADIIPFNKHVPALRAIETAFGSSVIQAIERITNGASGASVFKIVVDDKNYLLRLEGPPDYFRDPARQYACLKIAAVVGVAPRLHHANSSDGVAIIEFIHATSMGQGNLRQAHLIALVQSIKTLHAAPLFPQFISYMDGMGMLTDQFRTSHILPIASREQIFQLYKKLAMVYPRHDADLVSSHNDLNPGNILFNNDRALFVDWESAFAADRYVDLAAISNFFATHRDEEKLILETYFGSTLNEYHCARFFLMQQINLIFYGIILLNSAVAVQPDLRLSQSDMETPRLHQARHEMASMATLEGRIRFACIFLNEAAHNIESAHFAEAAKLMTA